MDFFGTKLLFSRIFQCPQRVPLSSILILCNRMYVDESKKVPRFYIFRHYAKFFERKKFKNFKFFPEKKVLRFLNLRYSTDFRRSRLVCLDFCRFSCFFCRTRVEKKWVWLSPCLCRRPSTFCASVNSFQSIPSSCQSSASIASFPLSPSGSQERPKTLFKQIKFQFNSKNSR